MDGTSSVPVIELDEDSSDDENSDDDDDGYIKIEAGMPSFISGKMGTLLIVNLTPTPTPIMMTSSLKMYLKVTRT